MILGWLNYTDLLCKGKETKQKAPIGAFIFQLAGVAGSDLSMWVPETHALALGYTLRATIFYSSIFPAQEKMAQNHHINLFGCFFSLILKTFSTKS